MTAWHPFHYQTLARTGRGKRRRSAPVAIVLATSLTWTSIAPPAHADDIGSPFATNQQIATQQNSYAQTQTQIEIQVSTDFLNNFVDSLQTFADEIKNSADFLNVLNDFKNFQRPDLQSPIAKAFYDKIAPLQDRLGFLGDMDPKHADLLGDVYDVLAGVKQDLDHPTSGPPTPLTMLSSNTSQALIKVGLDFLTAKETLQTFVDAKDTFPNLAIRSGFAKYVGMFAFGADDLTAGLSQLAATGDWGDPDTEAHLLNGLNRALWAGVGYLVSDGNRDVADAFSTAADLVVKAGSQLTLGTFINGRMFFDGFDQTILDTYAQAQIAAIAHGQAPKSFEEFVGFDKTILGAINAATRKATDDMFGVKPPPADASPVIVITTVTHESYRETCNRGFCVRTSLDAKPTTDPASASPVGGVRINSAPTLVGAPAGHLGAKVLGACVQSHGPACQLR